MSIYLEYLLYEKGEVEWFKNCVFESLPIV